MEGSEQGNGRLASHAVLAKLAWAMRSEPGDVRPHNEDCAGAYAPTVPDDAWDRPPLFVVCDGLGGHAAGEVASRTAVDAMLASWQSGQAAAPHRDIRAAARAANTAVYDAALEQGRRGMATTLTALCLSGTDLVVAHVGDSRAYLVRDGQCVQLTADHSRVGEMLRLGLITADQAASHPARSQLTRSVGSEPIVQVDIVRQPIQRDDVLVLCTDGLWDMVARPEIAEHAAEVRAGASAVTAAADQLTDLALKRGSPDNVTVLVVTVTTDRPIPPVTARRSLFRRGKA